MCFGCRRGGAVEGLGVSKAPWRVVLLRVVSVYIGEQMGKNQWKAWSTMTCLSSLPYSALRTGPPLESNLFYSGALIKKQCGFCLL